MSLTKLRKAVLGSEKPGHKYLRRVPRAGGGYHYVYENPEYPGQTPMPAEITKAEDEYNQTHGTQYAYRPGIMDATDPNVLVGEPIKVGAKVRVYRGGRGQKKVDPNGLIVWICDEQGNCQSVWKKALVKPEKPTKASAPKLPPYIIDRSQRDTSAPWLLRNDDGLLLALLRPVGRLDGGNVFDRLYIPKDLPPGLWRDVTSSAKVGDKGFRQFVYRSPETGAFHLFETDREVAHPVPVAPAEPALVGTKLRAGYWAVRPAGALGTMGWIGGKPWTVVYVNATTEPEAVAKARGVIERATATERASQQYHAQSDTSLVGTDKENQPRHEQKIVKPENVITVPEPTGEYKYDRYNPVPPTPAQLSTMPLSHVASIIQRDWRKVYFGAVPYLSAMHSLEDMTSKYGADDASSVVAYFLSNAAQWKGPVAKAVKQHLNKLLKTRKSVGTGLDKLRKAAKGSEKPGHKYTSRKPRPGGGYFYEYKDYKYHVASQPGNSASMRYSWYMHRAGLHSGPDNTKTVSGFAATPELAHTYAQAAIDHADDTPPTLGELQKLIAGGSISPTDELRFGSATILDAAKKYAEQHKVGLKGEYGQQREDGTIEWFPAEIVGVDNVRFGQMLSIDRKALVNSYAVKVTTPTHEFTEHNVGWLQLRKFA